MTALMALFGMRLSQENLRRGTISRWPQELIDCGHYDPKMGNMPFNKCVAVFSGRMLLEQLVLCLATEMKTALGSVRR